MDTLKAWLANNPALTIQGRVRHVHAFFRQRNGVDAPDGCRGLEADIGRSTAGWYAAVQLTTAPRCRGEERDGVAHVTDCAGTAV
jgi:hypothetical protein